MAAKLVAEEGTLKGLVLSLEDGDQWIIGRDPDACQLLVEDPSTSRKHLVCRTTPKGILVENLSQTNPTEVNDEEVKEPRLLHNGDAVKIGDGVFRFYADAAAQLFKEAPSDVAHVTGQEALTEKNGQEPHITSLEEHNEPKMEVLAENKTDKTDNPQSPPEAPANAPPQPEPAKDLATPSDDAEERHDTIFEEEPSDKHPLAEINFGLLDTGRWLLKVIGGPNNGAEFAMQAANSYVIGTDPNACDIVFHDTSVSRQHARITVGQDDTLTIEDLKSRNGTVVDGEPLTGKRTLGPNILVSIGTTSFIVFDREGEMQTIISPLMPSIVKVLQRDEPKPDEAAAAALQQPTTPTPPLEPAKPTEAHHHTTLGAFILIGILTGLFIVVGIGTSTLFKSEPVSITKTIDTNQALDSALAGFPSVKYTFNKNTGQLLLVGHVLSATDRNQLLYSLQGLSFIHNLDDSGLVIDEYVWREINQVVEKNPDWKGISVVSTEPGHFVVSGYLHTHAQADRLAEYLSANFPYPDLLEKRVVVDEDIVASVNSLLQVHGIRNVKVKLDNGELTISGFIPLGKEDELTSLLADIRAIRGIRTVNNQTTLSTVAESVVNITDKYEVSGISKQGGKLSVVINGRILMQGDILDGMAITAITPNSVQLEKDSTKYRIDFNR